MHKDYDYLHGKEITLKDGNVSCLCYIAGIDRDIGLTVKVKTTGEAIYCITRREDRIEVYNKVFDWACKQIEGGVIDISTRHIPTEPINKVYRPLICPFTEGDRSAGK